jgi:NADH:ubiquinone oxidoreductase subunit 6 (subunit J)
MQEFFTFKKFITPIFIQIIFWAGAVVIFIWGIVMIIAGASTSRYSYLDESSVSAGSIIIGLVIMLLGPVLWRIYCEILILQFKLYDEVHELRKLKETSSTNI